MKGIPQKSAFLLSHVMNRVEETINKRIVIHGHELPLLILSNYDQVIQFLGRYTSFIDYCNGDLLRAKWELKDACFCVDLTEYDLLIKEVMTDSPGGINYDEWAKTYYNEHMIHIHRLPVGITKRQLWPDYY